MPFMAVQSGFDPFFPRNTLQAYWKSQYLDELSDEAIDAIAAKAQDRPAPLTLVNTFHMGGAINDVGPEDTAFAERSAQYMVSIDGMWTDPATTRPTSPGCGRRGRTIRKFGTGGVYLNFTGLADEALSAGVDSALRAQPPPARGGEGDVRPGQLLPGEQQHPAGYVTAGASLGRAAAEVCRRCSKQLARRRHDAQLRPLGVVEAAAQRARTRSPPTSSGSQNRITR